MSSLVTKQHVTKMQAYCLEHRRESAKSGTGNGGVYNDFADGQHRLQLRLLTLLLARLVGMPTLEAAYATRP